MGYAFPIGRRLRKWRERTGLSASDVARRAGVSPAVLQAAEEGTEALSAYRFQRVALALGVDPAALLSDAPQADPLRSTARFRVQGEGSELLGPDVRLLSLGAEVGRIGGALARMLGQEPAPSLPMRSTPLKGKPWRQGYSLGAAARVELLPVQGPLVSVQAAFESLGIHVAFVEFAANDVEAASIREPGETPVILLNRRAERVSRPRTRRSVLAHELCHLLHDGSKDHVVTMITRATDFHVGVEQRANGFAPAFLAPPDWVDASGEPLDVGRRLVESWAFTSEGAAWHVRNLLDLSEADGPGLKAALLAANVFEGPVAESVQRADRLGGVETSPLVAGLVADLAQRALAEGHISEARAREIATFR